MKKANRTLGQALPWLIACLHAQTWADPMRPLVPPAAASAATAAPGAVTVERGARSREADGPKEPERLVAIRQDSSSRWLALFGERWVKGGDKVEHYTVGAIDGNSVQLSDGKQRRTLHLLPPLSPPGTGKPLAAAEKPPPVSLAPESAQTQTAALSPHRANGLPTP